MLFSVEERGSFALSVWPVQDIVSDGAGLRRQPTRDHATCMAASGGEFRWWNDGCVVLEEERRQVVEYCRRLRPDGLVVATSGNISVRSGDMVAVTPSGVDYHELSAGLICLYRLDGTPVEARLEPTTEMPLHLAIYRQTDARSVVHTHSTAATAVSTLVDELPPIHYLIAIFGGPVRVTPYATYGTDDLAAEAIEALDGRTACILGNHGVVAVGATLAEAYTRAVYLEWLCEVWLRASAVGRPRLLPLGEIERVRHRLSTYGASRPQD